MYVYDAVIGGLLKDTCQIAQQQTQKGHRAIQMPRVNNAINNSGGELFVRSVGRSVG